MNRTQALAYTGVAEAQMKEWERRGAVRFCKRGPNGQAIALKADLDAALDHLFATTAEEDLDFGE